jgi:hypothetical protein
MGLGRAEREARSKRDAAQQTPRDPVHASLLYGLVPPDAAREKARRVPQRAGRGKPLDEKFGF